MSGSNKSHQSQINDLKQDILSLRGLLHEVWAETRKAASAASGADSMASEVQNLVETEHSEQLSEHDDRLREINHRLDKMEGMRHE